MSTTQTTSNRDSVINVVPVINKIANIQLASSESLFFGNKSDGQIEKCIVHGFSGTNASANDLMLSIYENKKLILVYILKAEQSFEFNLFNLKFELLEPKQLRFYSFRIDKKYRAIFIFRNSDTIEIIDANNHYQ